MGYLNARPGDDYLLNAHDPAGTSDLAAPTAWEGVGQAIGQGLAKVPLTIADTAMDASRYVQRRFPAGAGDMFQISALANTVDELPDSWRQEYADTREKLEKWINSDKQYQGSAAQTVGAVTQGLGTFAPALLTGPAAPYVGAALMGGTMADSTYRDLSAQGVDDTTAKEAAAAQGIIGAVGAVVPFKFGNLFTRVAGGAGSNAALGGAARGANWAVLKANGYDDMAEAQRPLDAQALAADLIVGAGMGLGVHVIERAAGGKVAAEDRPPPSVVDDARAVADQVHADNAGPGVATTPETAQVHQKVFDDVYAAINEGREVRVPPEDARALVDGMAADPAKLAGMYRAMEWADQIPEVQLARTMEPLLAEAQARVDDARAARLDAENDLLAGAQGDAARSRSEGGSPAAQPVSDEGLAGRASPDAVDDAVVRQLEATHGDALIPQEDGTTKTVGEMAAQMREAVANVEADHQLLSAAVACFVRTGGVA